MIGELIGKIVVVDTDSSMIAIGRLNSVDSDSIMLEDVDFHDRSDAHSSKELYIINIKKLGVKPNRKKVYILRERIVAISELDDFIA